MKQGTKQNVYEIVTDRIVAQLKKGCIAWETPWDINIGMPRNLVSKKAYRGINVWLLAFSGYTSPYWMSYKQCQALGGTVNKGAKATLVTFWKKLEKSESKADVNRAEKDREYTFLLRYYNVFNLEQTSGIDKKHIPTEKLNDYPEIASAEQVIQAYENAPVVKHGGSRACYNPTSDEIDIPVKGAFKSNEEYYATMFHEMVHSTGHDSRLKRDLKNFFGSHEYSKEELVAEMGASFLCTLTGIETAKTEANHAAYIASWIKALTDDTHMVVSAASKAQEAVEHITHKNK